jgi:hypothetical protein
MTKEELLKKVNKHFLKTSYIYNLTKNDDFKNIERLLTNSPRVYVNVSEPLKNYIRIHKLKMIADE